MTSLLLAVTVSYQVVSGLPLKHDGYVVEKTRFPVLSSRRRRRGRFCTRTTSRTAG